MRREHSPPRGAVCNPPAAGVLISAHKRWNVNQVTSTHALDRWNTACKPTYLSVASNDNQGFRLTDAVTNDYVFICIECLLLVTHLAVDTGRLGRHVPGGASNELESIL